MEANLKKSSGKIGSNPWEKTGHITRMILKLNKKFVEIIPRPDDDCKLYDIFSQSYHFIDTYKGKIAYDHEQKRYYDGFYAPDVIHLALALKYKCDRLVTTDGDFDEVPIDVIPVQNIK